ncbi:hypothetical protein TNIN_155201 [Trichonephila inaurata madagascariensis]|uniref:Uncharacterized protein n=1 Tax=Trichonephila inaurata madagascariensis TaxID=2747483 RepID=A0A8X6Y9D5_9ARAC|nr:hypothetical protein TNIN_155201 [Trichonephila inaurata madagascariensis]
MPIRKKITKQMNRPSLMIRAKCSYRLTKSYVTDAHLMQVVALNRSRLLKHPAFIYLLKFTPIPNWNFSPLGQVAVEIPLTHPKEKSLTKSRGMILHYLIPLLEIPSNAIQELNQDIIVKFAKGSVLVLFHFY